MATSSEPIGTLLPMLRDALVTIGAS
jgi:hypothetical protein